MFTFLQNVTTPKGKAVYIGIVDGVGIQVARHVPFSELSREEIESRKPIVTEWDRETYNAWIKKATFCRNEIYQQEEVTG